MTATLVAFGATRFLVSEFIRPHFMAPLHRVISATTTSAMPGDWVLSNTLVDAGGRQITASREELAVLHAQQAGIDPHTYILTLGWRRIDLVSAGGPVLDVPASRSGALRRAGRRARARRALARSPDAGMSGGIDRGELLRLACRRRGCRRPAEGCPRALLCGRRLPAGPSALAVRVRQPRADQPVLRAGDERKPATLPRSSAST